MSNVMFRVLYLFSDNCMVMFKPQKFHVLFISSECVLVMYRMI